METIKYFLSKLFIFALIVGSIILIFVVLQKFAPSFMQKFSFKGGSGTFFTDNWLPDPVNLQKLSQPRTANLDNQVYEGGLTPGTSYVIYGKDGKMQIITVPDGNINSNNINNTSSGMNRYSSNYSVAYNALYVRNLSIFKDQKIKTGIVFYGEAKSTFFYNGTFPIYIFDAQNRNFAREMAVDTKQWAAPGWTRFSVKLYANFPPNSQPCTMLFAPGTDSPDKNMNYPVVLPIICN